MRGRKYRLGRHDRIPFCFHLAITASATSPISQRPFRRQGEAAAGVALPLPSGRRPAHGRAGQCRRLPDHALFLPQRLFPSLKVLSIHTYDARLDGSTMHLLGLIDLVIYSTNLRTLRLRTETVGAFDSFLAHFISFTYASPAPAYDADYEGVNDDDDAPFSLRLRDLDIQPSLVCLREAGGCCWLGGGSSRGWCVVSACQGGGGACTVGLEKNRGRRHL